MGWIALAGWIVGYDVAAILTGRPTLSADCHTLPPLARHIAGVCWTALGRHLRLI